MTEKHPAPIPTEANPVAETRPPEQLFVPDTDLYEREEDWILEADLPGVTRDRLDVQLDGGVLTVRAEARAGRSDTRLHAEFDPVIYERRFRIGDGVDLEGVTADLENGVLTLRLPKAEAMKPRKIEVKVSG